MLGSKCVFVSVCVCVCECVCMVALFVCHIEGKWERVFWVCVGGCVCACVCVCRLLVSDDEKKFILLSYQVLYISSRPLHKLASSKENPFFIKSLNNQKTLRKKLFEFVLIYKVILVIVLQQNVIYKLSHIVIFIFLY